MVASSRSEEDEAVSEGMMGRGKLHLSQRKIRVGRRVQSMARFSPGICE